MNIIKETEDGDKMLYKVGNVFCVVQCMNKSDILNDRSVTDCFEQKEVAEKYFEELSTPSHL